MEQRRVIIIVSRFLIGEIARVVHGRPPVEFYAIAVGEACKDCLVVAVLPKFRVVWSYTWAIINQLLNRTPMKPLFYEPPGIFSIANKNYTCLNLFDSFYVFHHLDK